MANGSVMNPMYFIHLFERISEPLGYGVRGDESAMVYFYYDSPEVMNAMVENDNMKRTMEMVRQRMEQVRGVAKIPIPMPEKMPNLKVINQLCPKRVNFCYFLPAHKKAFSILKEIFMKQSNTKTLFELACACRDHPMVNCQLFVYALCSCLVSRKDTRYIRIPSHFEIMPDNYCNADVVGQANKMSHMPEIPGAQHVVMVDKNFTSKGTDPEQKMWYFREDILVNSHHFHWHIVFPTCSPKDPKKEGYRERRGELFFYMHHSMIARYDAERLCNGLPRVRMFNFSDQMLEEGYFGKLSSENSFQQWGTRQAFTRLSDVQRTQTGDEGLAIRIEELMRWRDRIIECIDLGYYIIKDPETGKESRAHLTELEGVNILGDIIESSATLTPHRQFYGEIGFHNMGHVLIAFSHDPSAKHREKAGVMGDVSAAMRDPAFYRWHKYIDNLFDLYKKTLPPYPLDNDGKSKYCLRWKDVEVVQGSLYVKSRDSRVYNELRTFWDMKDVNLARGLDFRRSISSGMTKPGPPIIGRFTHLSHAGFDYFLKINNKARKPVLATIRIFMAPRYDENGHTFSLEEQRLLFFEMDKVPKSLNPGVNDIQISSRNSSVTLRDENGSSFENISKLYREAKTTSDVVSESQCSCGWPAHLLLPRGTTGGMEFDLFVIVTDGSQDMVNVNVQGCKSAFSFCGVLDQKYPDARPMGFPFDRMPFTDKAEPNTDIVEQCSADEVPVPSLEMYVEKIPNSAAVKIKIFHDNIMNKDIAVMGEQVTFPDGTCVRMQDYYQMKNKGDNAGSNRPGNNRRPPTNLNRPIQEPDYEQNQWGGVGNGGYQGTGRRGRGDNDSDWEHVGWDNSEY